MLERISRAIRGRSIRPSSINLPNKGYIKPGEGLHIPPLSSGSWSNSSFNSNVPDPLKFVASDYGISWTANFSPAWTIPSDLLYGVILGPTVGAVLGGVLGWYIPYYMSNRGDNKKSKRVK